MTEKKKIVLSIDPSLTCTGWAVLGSAEDLVGGGVITSHKHDSTIKRIEEINRGVDALLVEHVPDVVVIETPQVVMRGGRNRSMTSGASYGFCAGCVYQHVKEFSPSMTVVGVSATAWTANLGAARSTRRDPNKANRVRAAAYLMRVDYEAFGPKTTAGNIADAILLGRWWWLNQEQGRLAV